jgi:hypothetical protein
VVIDLIAVPAGPGLRPLASGGEPGAWPAETATAGRRAWCPDRQTDAARTGNGGNNRS